MIEKFCIVRCRDAGVHCGVVVAMSGRSVHLREARRVHHWADGANTLSEMSQHGCGTARISVEVPEILLLEASEVIPCSAEAEENLRQSRWNEPYKPSASRRSVKKQSG